VDKVDKWCTVDGHEKSDDVCRRWKVCGHKFVTEDTYFYHI